MLISGIINPNVLSLLARVRHTNALVIADWAFPSWPGLETIDLSLTEGVPTVLQVVDALLQNWKCAEAIMAEEFQQHHPPGFQMSFTASFRGTRITWEPHVALKRRVPGAIGLIRTGDTTIYSNVVLISG